MDLQEQLLKKAAKKLGIEVTSFENRKTRSITLRHQGKEQKILNGNRFDSTSKTTESLMDNKLATKRILNELSIPTPKGMAFSLTEDFEKEIKELFKQHPQIKKWVCKPVDSTEGIGVGMEMKSFENIEHHLELHHEDFNLWILEEQVEGEDLRIQVINGKLVAACRREPASAYGDGVKTIQELIDLRHHKTQQLNPENRCIADEETRELLSDQKRKLTDIPKKGSKIQLKRVVNMSQGGQCIDLTDDIHPLYHEWIETISEKLGVKIFSFDAITPDHQADPLKHCKVLELNARPVWLHHTFSEGRQHDIPTMIVKSLFGLS